MDEMDEDVEIAMKELGRAKTKTAKFHKPPFTPMSRREVENVLHISRSKIYEMMNTDSNRYDATFPKPLRWGARSVMWKQEEIFDWMTTRERTARIDDDE